jgi:hypothetical protein
VVFTAERRLLSDDTEAPSHGRGLSEVLSTRAMEARFAGGGLCGPQRFNLVAHRQLEKIILWDEGPAAGARSVAHLPLSSVLRCETFDSYNKTFISCRKTSLRLGLSASSWQYPRID